MLALRMDTLAEMVAKPPEKNIKKLFGSAIFCLQSDHKCVMM